jgi:hypothetical protein
VSDMVYKSHDKDGFSKIGPYATDSYSLVLWRGSLGRPHLSFSSLDIFPSFYFHNYISIMVFTYGVFGCVV